MGRRRAGAAPPDAPASAEPPAGRRSSRLATKERVDYNEDRVFKKILANGPQSAPKKSIAPRATKKQKDKLSKGGSVAVRITNEVTTTTTRTTTTTTRATAATKGKSAASHAEPPASTVTVTTTRKSIEVTVTTPVATRKRTRKQPAPAMHGLATIVEDDLSSFKSLLSSGCLKRASAPDTITPDTTQEIDQQAALRLRPTKKSRKERSTSPTASVGRRVQPRGITLFPRAREEEEDGAAAAAGEDAARAAVDDARSVVAMSDALFADADDWPRAEPAVPEKKRKKGTVARQGTVPRGSTVSWLLEPVDTKPPTRPIGGANKKSRSSATPAPGRQSRGRSGGSTLIMERTVKEEAVVEQREMPDDDAFRGDITQVSTDLETSLCLADQIEAGTLAIEDMRPEDRWLRELFSPARTPRLEHSLITGDPFILSASSSSSSSVDLTMGTKGRRAAGARARKNLSLLFEAESDADSVRSPSELRELCLPEPALDSKRAQKYVHSKAVRLAFSAARGRGFSGSKQREATRVTTIDETTSPATRRVIEKSMIKRKIQFPGIAPLPEDLAQENPIEEKAVPGFRAILDGMM